MSTAALLDEYERFLKAGGSAKTTISDRRSGVTRAMADLGTTPMEVTADALIGWMGRQGWKPQTRATYRSHLRAFFGWLADTERRLDNPAARLPKTRVPMGIARPVTDTELALAIERSSGRMLTAILLGAYAGLRISEIARLCREDVTEHEITVLGGKNGHDAILPCHPLIWAHVEPMPPGLLVRAVSGEPTTGHRLSASQWRHWKAIGLPDITWHRLRHWYGCSIHQAQGDLRLTQELLRHVSVTTTVIYTRSATAAKTAAIAALPVLAGVR